VQLPHLAFLTRDLLAPLGHEVALAPDGAAVLDMMRGREPDLLILDLNMPGLSGLDVCRAVKRNPFTAGVPVLMLTAQGDVENKVAGFDAGADDYLAKPFDPRELRARVTALLRLVRREGDRNPTSGLPGGRAIEEELERRVRAGDPFAVVYIDLDHFKPFADAFGFAVADRVIHDTGHILRAVVEATGNPSDFVGHIGGDDFIVVTTEGAAESIAREAAERFRDVVARVVGAEAMARGTFAGEDREGEVREFPLARLSAAVLTVSPGRWVSASHMATVAAEVKRRAKQRGGGTILTATV
jgi:PleD family two-component response regulator